MQPITREIIDRRAPGIRWSAVLAGTAAAVGLWGVFQLIGLGAGLSALDPDDARSLRHAAVGMTSFSALAPLVATFVGAWVAARLCAHSDRKVAATHGVVVWGLTAGFGVLATLWMASAAAIGGAHHDRVVYDRPYTTDTLDTDVSSGPTRPVDIDQTDLTRSDKPIAAAKRGEVKLDAEPNEDPNAPAVSVGPTKVAPPPHSTLRRVGEPAPTYVNGGRIDDPALLLSPDERVAMLRAKQSGHGLLTLGIAILLSIGTAILGAIVGLRTFERRPHTTAPYRAVDETV